MVDRNLILTGFMGSGKSSAGKVLANLTGRRFVDLDAEIAAQAGCSVAEIFARDGEKSFRILESRMLEAVLGEGSAPIVLATGGGAVIAEQNRSIMKRFGIVVNLRCSLDQIMLRISGSDEIRPLLSGADPLGAASALMSAREEYYSDADIKIDTNGKSVEDVAREVLWCLEEFSGEKSER